MLGSLSAQTWKTCPRACLEVVGATYCESVFTANSWKSFCSSASLHMPCEPAQQVRECCLFPLSPELGTHREWAVRTALEPAARPLCVSVSVRLSQDTNNRQKGCRQGQWPWQAVFPKGLGPASGLRHSPFPVGAMRKTDSEEEFQEQMHCHGQSKVAVKFDIQLAKLPQLKVILQQLCTNSAGSGLEVNLNYLISAQQLSVCLLC